MSAMNGIDFFPVQFSGEEQIFALDDHQIAALLKAMFTFSRAYARGEVLPIEIDDPMVKLVFIGQFGAVRERYDEYRRKCEINSLNARGHGAPKGNQNARKYTEDEVEEARKRLEGGDFSAAGILAKAAAQRATDRANSDA